MNINQLNKKEAANTRILYNTGVVNDKSMEPKEKMIHWTKGKLFEEVEILKSQSKGFQDQLQEMRRLYDSSQEEVKRLKEDFKSFREATSRADNLYISLNWEEHLPIEEALLKRNLELEGRVKELTEERDYNILQFLNNSEEYKNRIKELTIALRERKGS